MSLNQRVTAEFSTCTPSAPPTAHLSIQTIRELSRGSSNRNAECCHAFGERVSWLSFLRQEFRY